MSSSASYSKVIDKFYSHLSRPLRPSILRMLTFIGVTWSVIKVLQYLNWVRPIFRYSHNLEIRYGSGSWAVVTGASQGIGRAYCIALAKRNFNVVLISRDIQKLMKVTEEIKQVNPTVQTKIVVADLSQSHQSSVIDNIWSQIDKLDISILVNNVGVGESVYFPISSDGKILEVITTNVLPQTMLTRRVIPVMQGRYPKKCAIVTVSSVGGCVPNRYSPLYSACKAFDDCLSNSLSLEYDKSNIDFLSVRPYVVTTSFVGKMSPRWFSISDTVSVESALHHLGYETTTFGPLKHRILGKLFVNSGFFRRWTTEQILKAKQETK